MEKMTPMGRTKDEPKRKEEKMPRKKRKEDQLTKVSEGEDVDIQQLSGVEKCQEKRWRWLRRGKGESWQPSLTLLMAFRALVAAPYAAVPAFVF